LRPDQIISNTLKEVSTLRVENNDLHDSLTKERVVFGKIILDLSAQIDKKKDECTDLARHLSQAQEMLLDKDVLIEKLNSRIADLEKSNADMQDKVQEGIRKGWHLDELSSMIFGKKSEKHIPDSDAVNAAIQQTLGTDFDYTEIEEVIAQARTVAAAKSNLRELRTHDTLSVLLQNIPRVPVEYHSHGLLLYNFQLYFLYSQGIYLE
jgi:chromosome segregation ATPase